jgi:hypothetical protein
MRAVAPVETPVPVAMMMKYTGRERDKEASAWVEMRPAK